MTAVLVCAGTAGHINPALSIADEIKKRNPESKIYFIGADRELENRLVPEAGYELFNITMSGIRRGFTPSDIIYNIKTIKNTFFAGMKSKKLLKKLNPDFVIGTGGYVCYPVIKKASKRGIATYIHESNAIPGMAVKMLSSYLDKIFVTFDQSKSYYKQPDKVIYTGTPIRKEFFEYLGEEKEQQKSFDKPLLVSFWGSLGSSKMNDMMPEFIKQNIEESCFYHIHAIGGSEEEFMEKLHSLGIKNPMPPFADIREYISDMPQVLARADLALCRAGGSTIAELTATFTPALLVPSPYVVDDQQKENAKMLERAGAVKKIQEINCTPELLYEKVKSMLDDEKALHAMKTAQRRLYKENAAKKIVDLILQE